MKIKYFSRGDPSGSPIEAKASRLRFEMGKII